MYHRHSMQNLRRLEAFLEQHPDRLARIYVEEASAGYVTVGGEVNSREDMTLFQDGLKRLFGEDPFEAGVYDSVTVTNGAGEVGAIHDSGFSGAR